MGETKTFGVKVPEELQAEAARLQKEFGTGEEFLATLLNCYKTEKTKEQVPMVAQDLKELQSLTKRIDSIFLNLAYRADNLGKEKDMEYQDVIAKKDAIVSDLQSKLFQLEDEKGVLTTAFNNSVNDKNEVEKRVIELTNMYNDNKALVEEYKSKNDTLTGMLQKYEKYPDELEEYKKLLTDCQTRCVELSNELKSKNEDIERLTLAFEELKGIQKTQIKELEGKQADEIKRVREQAAFDKDKALLEKDKEYQNKINEINTENNKYVKELLHENQEYNEKVSKLVEDNQIKNNRISEMEAIIKTLKQELESKKKTK